MASYRAIGATCEAVVRLLQHAWQPDLFDGAELQFEVYCSRDFAAPMEVGVSLFLYAVTRNGVQRQPPARPAPDGTPRRPQLPLDLHFLLTPWANDASLEQEILGWLMRTLEDSPLLSGGMLNAAIAGVFEPEEGVELVQGPLATEEIVRLWDVLPADFQLSVPYTARIVRIDSLMPQVEAGPVLTRQLDFGKVVRP